MILRPLPTTKARRRGALCLLYTSLLGCAIDPSSARADDYLRYDGEARGTDGALLYGERHILRRHDGVVAERLVLYTCPDGRAFARKWLRYSPSRIAPDLDFEDRRSGLSHELRTDAAGHHLRVRHANGAPARTVDVAPDPSIVADAGFDEFIRRSFGALAAGRVVPLRLMLLSDGSLIDLKTLRLESTPIQGSEVYRFHVTLSSWLRLVAPDIDVYYTAADHELRRFVGITNIRDSAGRQIRAVIDFPPERRVAVPADAWAEARDLALTSRCAP